MEKASGDGAGAFFANFAPAGFLPWPVIIEAGNWTPAGKCSRSASAFSSFFRSEEMNSGGREKPRAGHEAGLKLERP